MNILPDISFLQNDPTTPQMVDFEKMRPQTDSVIFGAAQAAYIDRDFKSNWQRTKEAGLKRGSYWYYDSRANPKRQAELWVEAMGWDLGDLELWCDYEEKYGGQYAGWRNWFDFMERLKQLVGNKQLGVYTGYYYWIENTIQKGITDDELAYFAKYPLWIAWYNPEKPKIPAPFTDWYMWQFTDAGDGEKYGVESKEIDLNYTKAMTVNKRHMTAFYPDKQILYTEA